MATKNRKVQVESGVDSTGARKGFAEIKDAAKDMSKAVVQEGQAAGKGVEAVSAGSDAAAKKIERDTKSMIAQVQRVTAAMQAGSKDSAAFFNIRAQQRGIDPAALQPYLAELEKVRRAQQAAQGTLDGMGMSAKATTAALRQVPAQFTDIVTSLQGGQNPLTVLLQQGGQLKDVFGGVGPAARALGGYILGLVSPTTLAAGATVALTYAWYQGSVESQQFTRELALSGNQIGLTTAQLTDMARAVREVGAGTQGRASEVLAALASDGNLAADGLQRYTEVALRLEKVGGPAAEQTAKMFSEIGRSPVEAALKYNQALNFLTPAIYAQIKALQEQGKTQEASRVALDALSGATDKQAQQIGESLGYLQRLAKATGDGFKSMWDSLLDVGRPDGELANKIKDAGNTIEFLQRLMGGAPLQALQNGAGTAGLGGADLVRKKAAEDEAEAKRRQFLATQGLADLDKQAAQYLPKRVQMERELAQAREAAGKALAGDLSAQQRAEIQRTLAQTERGIRDKFNPGADQAGPASALASIKRDLGALTAAYSDAEAILEANRRAGLVDEAAYYEAKRAFIRLDQAEQVRAVQAEIDLDRKRSNDPKLTTQQRAAALDKVADGLTKIDQINAKAAASAVVLGVQQTSALTGIDKAYRQAQLAAEDYLTTLVRTQQRELDLFGASDRERQTAQGGDQIRDKYSADRQRIQNERALTAIQQGGTLTSDQAKQFDDLLALNAQYQEKALTGYADYVERRKALEADWAQGAGRAFRNYVEDAEDVAGQTGQAFSRGFQMLEDSLVTFVTTGKFNFKSLADFAIAELTRILVKQQLVNVAKAAGSFFGITGYANGGAFDAMGEVKRFARGDVFDQPTAFSYAGGSRAGILGEAGPEAILPLARGAGGQLGVKVADGAKASPSIVFAPTIQMDGSVDRARGLQDAQQVMRQGQREMVAMLRAEGVLA